MTLPEVLGAIFFICLIVFLVGAFWLTAVQATPVYPPAGESFGYSNSFSLPISDNLHQAFFAFFRTSEHGTWKTDISKAQDAFELNFVRGRWTTSKVSKERVPAEPEYDNKGKPAHSTRPATCQVLLRPSAKSVKVVIAFRVFYCEAIPSFPGGPREHAARFWEEKLAAEVDDLALYLKEALGLDDAPSLENSLPPG